MDSSSTPPNHPLAFTHHHLPFLPSSSTYNYPIAAPPPPPTVEKDAGGEGPPGTTSGATATDLSMFKGGPKLEDFLGGSGGGGVGAAAPLHHHNFSTTTQTVPVTATVSDNDIYDSELKTIAASFLRGLSSDHQQTNIIHNQQQQQEPAPKRSAVDTFGQRTSIYRGVTRHRWTGRYEAHLWDNSCRREGQSRKGRQGGYHKEDKAARAYDLAALKYWGPTTTTNFPISNYEKELEEMKNMSRQEFVASLRRKSSGFSRGASIYRGVTRHHQHGRWQARIGRVAGNKDLYLGTFSTQEEAAEAYDIAAIKFRGLNAVTNFDMSRYDVKSIANSNFPIGLCNKSKTCSDSASDHSKSTDEDRDLSSVSSSGIPFISQPAASSTLSFAIPVKQDPSADYWSNIFGYNNNAGGAASSNNGYGLSYGGNSTVNESINNGLLTINGGGYVKQQQQQQQESGVISTNSLPFATPIVLNNNNYESSSSGYGNWNIAQSLHSSTYQTAKPSISVFQTPIFGME